MKMSLRSVARFGVAILLVSIFVLTVPACSDSNDSHESDPCANGGCGSGFAVSTHEIKSSDSIALGGEIGSDYLLIPYYTGRVQDLTPYEVKVNGHSVSNKIRLSATPGEKEIEPEPFSLAWRQRFDRQWRVRDRELWEKKKHSVVRRHTQFKSGDQCATSFDCGENELCESGSCTDTANFYFPTNDEPDTIAAKVQAVGERCAVLVDESDLAAIDSTLVRQILETCDDIIVPRARFFFGEPTSEDTEGSFDASDCNEDGLLHLFITSKVNDEGAWGFFYSGDFYESEPGYLSNERDMVYIAVPEDESEVVSLMATVIHEYQHLLHFTIHNWIPELQGDTRASSPIWLDEAFAHLSEEIGGYGIDNLELIQSTLAAFPELSLAFGSDTLNDRGYGMLFILYLYEQSGGVRYSADALNDLGGATFLKNVIAAESIGFTAIEDAFGVSFDEAFFDWVVTLSVSNSGVTDNPRYNYADIVTDPLTGREIGVMTHGTRESEYGESYSFDGPAKTELKGTSHSGILSASGANVIPVSGDREATRASVEGPSGNFHLGVVRLR